MKLNSEVVRASMTRNAPAEKKRLVWRWEKCIPLMLIMTALAVAGASIPWLLLLRALIP